MIDTNTLAGSLVSKCLFNGAAKYVQRWARLLRPEMVEAEGLPIHLVGSLDFEDPQVNLGDVAMEAFADNYGGDIDEECWPIFFDHFEYLAQKSLKQTSSSSFS